MIKVGIYGYGHLGRGVELALRGAPDMEPAAIFTRRPPDEVRPVTENLPVLSENTLGLMAQRLDVVILCGSRRPPAPRWCLSWTVLTTTTKYRSTTGM